MQVSAQAQINYQLQEVIKGSLSPLSILGSTDHTSQPQLQLCLQPQDGWIYTIPVCQQASCHQYLKLNESQEWDEERLIRQHPSFWVLILRLLTQCTALQAY